MGDQVAFPAEYFDGLSARSVPVYVEIDRRVLRIYDESGVLMAHWPARRVARAPAHDHKAAVRLRLKGYSHVRLVFHDPQAIRSLRDHHPRLFIQRTSIFQFARFATTLAVFTALLVASIYFLVPRAAGPLATHVPQALEDRIGDATIGALIEDMGECKGDGLHDLKTLARLLVDQRSAQPVRVYVIDHPVPNAFAVPGGRIIFTAGLIDYLEDPDELVGALAHEIGHVILRHPLKGAISQFGILFFDAFITGGISDASGVGSLLIANAYTRDFEWEADREAILVLNGANAGTEGFIRLMKRFAETEDSGNGQPSDVLLRTHPFARERAEAAQSYVSTRGEPVLSDEAWKRVKAVCEDI